MTTSDVSCEEQTKLTSFWQARSQACVSGVEKLYWRNHVVHNLRAYFILYVITIKWTMCVHEKIELSGMSQRPRLS